MKNQQEMAIQKFNAEATYGWSPEQSFYFTGQEFSLLFNSLKNYISGEVNTVGGVMSVGDSFRVLHNKLKEMVEAGIISEYNPEEHTEIRTEGDHNATRHEDHSHTTARHEEAIQTLEA